MGYQLVWDLIGTGTTMKLAYAATGTLHVYQPTGTLALIQLIPTMAKGNAQATGAMVAKQRPTCKPSSFSRPVHRLPRPSRCLASAWPSGTQVAAQFAPSIPKPSILMELKLSSATVA